MSKLTVLMLARCGAMPSILNDVLMHGQDSAALEAAHTLVRTLTSEREYASATGSMESLEEALEEMGFRGLWKASFQEMTEENRAECFGLTEKLIEVSTAVPRQVCRC